MPSQDRAAMLIGPRTAVRTWFVVALLPAFFAAVLFQLARPLFGSRPWLVYVQDDFFYYLKVAENLATGHGSTFNGLVLTNGYHPLWLLTWTAICAVSRSELWLGIAMTGVTLVAVVATFLLTARLFRQFGVCDIWSWAFGLVSTYFCLTLFYCGMEITLTIPLALAVMVLLSRDGWDQRGFVAWVGVGVLLSATILSRLDSGLFVLMLLAGFLLSPELRRRLGSRAVAGLALGFVPVLLYLCINRGFFGVWMPVSGMAKQLRFTRAPARLPLEILFSTSPKAAARLLPVLLGLGLFARLRRRFAPEQRVVLLAALLFPLLHIFVLSVASDWLLWPWYVYPLRLSFAATLLLLARSTPGTLVLRIAWLAPALGVIAVLGALTARRVFDQETAMYDVARDLTVFAAAHPGVYAMGDRSGIVGYLLPAPLVQTEGLMMDRAFVEFIRREVPLDAVLQHYHVRYYVATEHSAPAACFHAVEPWQAGRTSPHMTSTFCAPPVATFHSGAFPTLIFDVSRSDVPRAAGEIP